MVLNISKQLVNPPGSKPGSHSKKGDTGSNESQRIDVQMKCARVSRLADQLEKILPRLHHLDEKSVIAPEIEEQYAMKEETEKELAGGIKELNEDLPLLEKEVQRCRENLQRIEGDSAKLNRREPMRSYLEAQAENGRCSGQGPGRHAYLTEEEVSRQGTSEAISVSRRKARWHAQIFTVNGHSISPRETG